jgi:hypothetical protein
VQIGVVAATGTAHDGHGALANREKAITAWDQIVAIPLELIVPSGDRIDLLLTATEARKRRRARQLTETNAPFIDIPRHRFAP